MTEQELKNVFDHPDLIAHDNMVDVAFYPTGIQILDKVYKLDGMWYNKPMKGFIANNSGSAIREEITIKKEDLKLWKKIKV